MGRGWAGFCATIIKRQRDGASAGSVFWPYGVLRIINDRGDVFALGDYSTGLKPDGSGKLVAKANSGDVVTWEFAAGQGSRPIRMTTSETTCVWRYVPR